MRMSRIVLVLLVLPLFATACSQRHAEAQPASGAIAIPDADREFAAGNHRAALALYDAAQKRAPDDTRYTRALFRAAECEALLGEHEHALDRARAARVPSDPALAALVQLLRAELLTRASWWGVIGE